MKAGTQGQRQVKEMAAYIFGAHSRARTLAAYLRHLHPDTDIRAFLVDNDEENPTMADGIRVIRLDTKKGGTSAGLEIQDEDTVYIATRGIYHERILKKLKAAGFKNIIPVTPEFDTEIRTRYLKDYFKNEGKEFLMIDDLKTDLPDAGRIYGEGHRNVRVYVARTASDAEPEGGYDLPPYSRFLQVGTELTDCRISDGSGLLRASFDNEGDNISCRNRQFCELTGLYWIWKNAREDIVGLEHYRRHFILPYDWADRMISNNIDVILPIPLYVSPSVEGNYKERHIPKDWDFVMGYLKENSREYFEFAGPFFRGNLYSPCNMFIMRKSVLDSYCEWVFPILFALSEASGERKDRYQNRYPGFIAERLMTLYFAKNEAVTGRVYANKNFLT